ncbi:hypothetical protein BRADO4721 [Bradyrhizobium sp. ORS 278]|nr:hypothetical protein BRADO4721 [Bradyrhizobium sp. ORS 278]
MRLCRESTELLMSRREALRGGQTMASLIGSCHGPLSTAELETWPRDKARAEERRAFMSRRRRILKPVAVLILAATLGGCLASAQGVERPAIAAATPPDRAQTGRAGPATYDPAVWFRNDFWGHEWPDGFTVNNDITLTIRTRPEIGAPKSVSCLLRRGATYHPWNTKRVNADRLSFVTFTRIRTYQLTRDYSSDLPRLPKDEHVKVTLKAGDRWSAVGPGAEGFFLMRVGTEVYRGYQDLFDASTEVGGEPAAGPEDDDQQWLQLRCANGITGWIFYTDVKDAPGFSRAQECGFGCAEDRKPARRRSTMSQSGATR